MLESLRTWWRALRATASHPLSFERYALDTYRAQKSRARGLRYVHERPNPFKGGMPFYMPNWKARG